MNDKFLPLRHTVLRSYALLCLVVWLGGCAGGAVVFAPTPLPPDVSPSTYTHRSGAFSLIVPRNWSVYEDPQETIAAASFSPPDSTIPLVRVALVNTGETITLDTFGQLLLQYQTQIRPDLRTYKEQDRQAMPDGSWRVSGIREGVGGVPTTLNTFIQRSGTVFVVIEAILSANPAQQGDVQTFLNTLAVYNDTSLPVAPLAALSGVSFNHLEITNVSTWSTREGVFYITGEVVNRGVRPLISVPIRATLHAEDRSVLAGAEDKLMGHGILPNSFMPFSLRFGQGQPPASVAYDLVLGSADWQNDDTLDVVGEGVLVAEFTTSLGGDGQLFITGHVTNNGSQPLREVMAVATLFGENGRVIGAGFAPINQAELGAIERAEFVILLTDRAGTFENIIVTAQGLR